MSRGTQLDKYRGRRGFCRDCGPRQIFVSKIIHHWLIWEPAACSAPNQCLTKYWLTVHWAHNNKCQWRCIQITTIFEDVVCKVVSIWSHNFEPIHREICIWFSFISMWDLWYLWIVASWALVRRATMIYAERRHGKHPGYYQANERDTRSAG